MNVLFEMLNELNYATEQQFSFEFTFDDKVERVVATPFVSTEFPSQAYIIVEVRNSKLNVVNSDFYKMLAIAFRKLDFHESDMDKNTTLVISSVRDNAEALNSAYKVSIEDNPYYFKKYVFSYMKASEKHAVEYLTSKKENYGNPFSYKDVVLSYLLEAEYFSKYKESKDDYSAYAYFMELATKIPAFPLKIATSSQIKTVNQFLKENMNEDSIVKLDKFLDKEIDFKTDSIESIIDKYKSIV